MKFVNKFVNISDSKYEWTQHSRMKMQHYGLSESRVKRIIRFPKRYEEGVAEKTVAVMQPAGTKNYQEIWVMYKIVKSNLKSQISNLSNFSMESKKIKIITAWRYPGKSPERDPVPQEIIREVQALL